MPRYVRIEAYPDEELCSILIRALRRTGLSEAAFVRWYLDSPATPLTSIDNLAPLMAKLLGVSPHDLLSEHTLVPYCVAGLSSAARRHCLIEFASGCRPEPIYPLGRLTLRWCIDCIRSELAEFGETYWHRSHLLPGVLICLVHGRPLLEVGNHASMVRLPLHLAVTYWLGRKLQGKKLPHEMGGARLAESGAALPHGLAHEFAHKSVRALLGRRALPSANTSPVLWRQVFPSEFVHACGCRGNSISRMPQTTAHILGVVAKRRLGHPAMTAQGELPFL